MNRRERIFLILMYVAVALSILRVAISISHNNQIIDVSVEELERGDLEELERGDLIEFNDHKLMVVRWNNGGSVVCAFISESPIVVDYETLKKITVRVYNPTRTDAFLYALKAEEFLKQ